MMFDKTSVPVCEVTSLGIRIGPGFGVYEGQLRDCTIGSGRSKGASVTVSISSSRVHRHLELSSGLDRRNTRSILVLSGFYGTILSKFSKFFFRSSYLRLSNRNCIFSTIDKANGSARATL